MLVIGQLNLFQFEDLRSGESSLKDMLPTDSRAPSVSGLLFFLRLSMFRRYRMCGNMFWRQGCSICSLIVFASAGSIDR